MNDIKEKCVPNEEKLDGIDKEIRKYCNERDWVRRNYIAAH